MLLKAGEEQSEAKSSWIVKDTQTYTDSLVPAISPDSVLPGSFQPWLSMAIPVKGALKTAWYSAWLYLPNIHGIRNCLPINQSDRTQKGRKYKLWPQFRIYTYGHIWLGEGRVLAMTKVVKMPFTACILYGNLERKKTPLKSGWDALPGFSIVWTVVLYCLLEDFTIFREDT